MATVADRIKTYSKVALVKQDDFAAMRDDKAWYWGDDADVKQLFSTSRRVVSMDKAGTFGMELDGVDLHDRLVLVERFHQRPQLNAAVGIAANVDWEIAGTGASGADCTLHAEGGVELLCDADGDSTILQSHQDTQQSAWAVATWGTDQESRFECVVRTDASIGDMVIWAGFKLTNTPVTATDNDQAFIRYENGINGGKWQAISSIGGTDDAHDSGVTVEVSKVYHLVVEVGSDRKAKFYINGTLVETSGVLTDTTDLKPFVGVKADGAAAKKIRVRWIKGSRKYA